MNNDVRWNILFPKVCGVSFKEKRRDYILPPESHPGIELCFVDRGALHAHISGPRGASVDLHATSGTLMCWLAGDQHSLYAAPGEAPNLVTIYARGTLPRGFKRLSRKLLYPDADDRKQIKALLNENQHPDELSPHRLSALFITLLVSLMRKQSSTNPQPKARGKSTTKKAIPGANVIALQEMLATEAQKEIEQRLSSNQDISVQILSKALHISDSHLSHTFRAIQKTSVMAYVREKRIKFAQELLRDSALSITDIAAKCGFASVHPFSRAFKKTSGLSPSKYAKSVRPDQL